MSRIPIGSVALDDLLGGGLEKGAITLLFGEAGTGKTNICLQVARNVALAGRKAIYIDTEGVSLERLRQISGERYEEVMKNVLFFEPHSFEEQEQLVERAVRLAMSNADIGVIILDSATIHYRLTRNDDEKGVRKNLSTQLSRLLSSARSKLLPVLLTSQVYTDIDKGTFEPLGGHVLLHNAKAIIRLDKVGASSRRAVVMKHRHLEEGRRADFKLTHSGVV
ncbi:MAG TPA: DNA repair and recombination protein RadB [Thermoplasmata archaeon]|nr:DNA repair and recombination protein RadB [Thermoplasmata archaeon]HUS56519.1 DNA repair and recombination protein RadB [Thermoplasmata archaeon]